MQGRAAMEAGRVPPPPPTEMPPPSAPQILRVTTERPTLPHMDVEVLRVTGRTTFAIENNTAQPGQSEGCHSEPKSGKSDSRTAASVVSRSTCPSDGHARGPADANPAGWCLS